MQPECCCSVAKSCLILCDPLDCSLPGLPVLHHLWEFSQVHVHEYLSLNLKARRGCNLSGSRWSGVGPAEKYGLQHCLGVKWDLSGQRLKRSEAILVKVSQPWHYCHLGQDNHDGVITNLEPDILECEVKWALGSINTNKASGGDGIPVELFHILKDDAESAELNMPANLENSAVATGLEKVSFHSNPKEKQCQRMFKLLHNCTHPTC